MSWGLPGVVGRAKDVVATSMALGKTIKKIPVLVGVCFGFVSL